MDSVALTSMAIPIVGIAFSVGAPVLVTWMVLRHLRQRAERMHQTVLTLADKGLPVPAALLDPTRARRSPFSTPLTLIGVGAGWAAAFALIGDGALRFGSPLGLLPACIGVAQLIALSLDRRFATRADDQPSS